MRLYIWETTFRRGLLGAILFTFTFFILNYFFNFVLEVGSTSYCNFGNTLFIF